MCILGGDVVDADGGIMSLSETTRPQNIVRRRGTRVVSRRTRVASRVLVSTKSHKNPGGSRCKSCGGGRSINTGPVLSRNRIMYHPGTSEVCLVLPSHHELSNEWYQTESPMGRGATEKRVRYRSREVAFVFSTVDFMHCCINA